MIEMANYGYRVSPEDLQGMSTAALRAMLDDARAIKGADRDMTPIYPGFPKQVQDLDTLTLIVEQILHYWSGGTFLPDYPHVVREGSGSSRWFGCPSLPHGTDPSWCRYFRCGARSASR
jgi:hypothetical protein